MDMYMEIVILKEMQHSSWLKIKKLLFNLVTD